MLFPVGTHGLPVNHRFPTGKSISDLRVLEVEIKRRCVCPIGHLVNLWLLGKYMRVYMVWVGVVYQ
jgi:hypothetical protein